MVCFFCSGFPGTYRRIFLRVRMEDIQSLILQACLTWNNFERYDLLGSFLKSLWVRTKHDEKTRAGLWSQSKLEWI